MIKNYRFFFLTLFLLGLNGCQTISTKVDEATQKEQKLDKWIGKTEVELTSALGKPDKIDFENTGNRNYVYLSKKLKIKCERKFEIDRNNVVLGFSSKNCF